MARVLEALALFSSTGFSGSDMPNVKLEFKSPQEEANWLERKVAFLNEQADFLRTKYGTFRWAQDKVRGYEDIAEYLQQKMNDLDDGDDGEAEGPSELGFDDGVPF